MKKPMATPLIPNWNRVTSPTAIFEMLKIAVDEGNK